LWHGSLKDQKPSEHKNHKGLVSCHVLVSSYSYLKQNWWFHIMI
jgi:hypothetical protein